MSRTNSIVSQNEAFICVNCGRAVAPAQLGSRHRNHCPHCLWSRHVDMRTGDRRSSCRGGMRPIGIWVADDSEWSLVHRCEKCGFLRSNRIGAEDNEGALLALALKPIAGLPFPAGPLMEGIAELHLRGEIV